MTIGGHSDFPLLSHISSIGPQLHKRVWLFEKVVCDLANDLPFARRILREYFVELQVWMGFTSSDFLWSKMLDWNDFRLVLAISRASSLKGAATALCHDHSTIFRWLNSLESKLQVQLFERDAGVYRATDAGERMILSAERMEEEALALDRDITGRDARLSGNLRITCSETLAYRLLNDLLASFRSRHEGITLELLVDNRQLDLLRREADIAIRATRPVEGDLFGRQIAETAWALYASPRYLSSRPNVTVAPFEGHSFIGWDTVAVAAAAKWLADTVPSEAIVYRSNSLINQMMAVKAGIGMALLPCYLGDQENDIISVSGPAAALTRELWLITHKDLRHTARVRAFFDAVGQGLIERRQLLEGALGRRQT